ncbi:MAG TPA: ECF-type sigma factor [Lacipirellulaceae bacterium]|nr:ECF-type sigma factor [Lacipirellulaceae bacterium]
MPNETPIDELVGRVRSGESAAAEEIVRRYEMAIRVAVRIRLSDQSLRRQFDSMDICQSVLASFFLRAAAGQFDLSDPAQLVALLTKMACNKLAMHARSEYRQRRDVRRATRLPAEFPESPLRAPQPVNQLADRDLLNRAFELMEPQVREMADSRAEGAGWTDIASKFGGTAEARRKQFRRAMDRIAETLQVE